MTADDDLVAGTLRRFVADDGKRHDLDEVAREFGVDLDSETAAPARRMGYGWGPWTAETLQACRCGHLRGDHFRHSGTCLHSTDTETWACDCPEFEAR